MITTDIHIAQQELMADGIIGLPTETVYGLAGNAYSETAIRKIFVLKNRPFFNPLIVHIKSPEYLKDVAREVPEIAVKLAKAFWPGPLTLVLKKQNHIPDMVTSGKDTVAVRVPNHPVALALLEKLAFPLAAPSANPFGTISPTRVTHVLDYFGEALEVILDGGPCEQGIESTIIGFENDRPVLYRLGSLSLERIENITGKLFLANKNDSKPDAPGMLSRHYAPDTPTYLTDNPQELIGSFPGKKPGLLRFKDKIAGREDLIQEVLSETGNLQEASKNLYASMHRLDRSNVDIIVAERLPDTGLGRSINDRLERATKNN